MFSNVAKIICRTARYSTIHLCPLEKDKEIRDAYVKLICQAYHVSEEWLRNGTLPMFTDERDRELDELLNLFDNLTPDLRKFLLKQAQELEDLQKKLNIIAIGKPLILSPAFPLLHTVHATFTAYGVPLINNLLSQ